MKNILFVCLCMVAMSSFSQKQWNALYITGHTDKYHSWEVLSQYQVALLEETGLFQVDVKVLPKVVTDESVDFRKYDVVILNVNEVSWPIHWKKQFEKYMRKGGGLVIIHEADNAFPEWKEFNKMIGLGGWGNRNEKDGAFYYWENGNYVVDSKTPGSAGKHGKRIPFIIHLRQPEHPIVKGLPIQWLHINDELYGDLRGSAENMEVLATAYSDAGTGGTGKEEPVLFTVHYGKGRIFHCVLGHTKKSFDEALKNMGYQIVFQRGTEWAATGSVTSKMPDVVLSANSPSLRGLEEINKKK